MDKDMETSFRSSYMRNYHATSENGQLLIIIVALCLTSAAGFRASPTTPALVDSKDLVLILWCKIVLINQLYTLTLDMDVQSSFRDVPSGVRAFARK